MQVIKLLPGQTVLDSNGQEIPVEDFDSLVCFYDEEREEALDKLYDQYGEEYINSQLEKGMQVEREHSDDREMQYSMARDHILEFVDYYEYLEVMEAEMEKGEEDALTSDVSEDTLLERRKKMRESSGSSDKTLKLTSQQEKDIEESYSYMSYRDQEKMKTLILRHVKTINALHRSEDSLGGKQPDRDTKEFIKAMKNELRYVEGEIKNLENEYPNKIKESEKVRYYNKPVAAKGLTSYRYEGPYGFIMIGARDVKDALSEAKRSTSKVDIKNLQVWDDQTGAYVPISLLEKKRN